MSEQAVFSLRNRNPDVLTCIANLSNDEVFTPPELARQILDLIAAAWANANDGANIWADKSLTFFDPFTKSGVFLREITSRLTEGLKDEIPDIHERVDHILTKQVFGMGITHLTSLIARRSVYCSKWANGKHSVATSFVSDAGNIWFETQDHTWVGATEFVETADENGNPVSKGTNGKCKYCGASQRALDRSEGLETHAYAFIHTDDIKAQIHKLFGENMQFDVIVGNPPYQLDDGGFGTSAAPIYNKFVDQAKKLNPRLLTMIIPARWFAGGKGLDEFRESMLTDDHLRSIDDYLNASDVFPGVGLKGGVCYFLWDRDNPGSCRVTTHFKDETPSTVIRPLLEHGVDVFIRFNEGLSILKKVVAVETGKSDSLSLPESKRFDRLVSSRKPFGLETTFKGKAAKGDGDLLIYQNGGTGYVSRSSISTGTHLIDKWKIYTGRAAPGTGNRDTYPHRIISTPFVGEPGSISSETYLCIGPFDSKSQAESALSYLSCRLTRLLILLHKPSQDTTRKVYTFVPTQEWTRRWTDEDLYAKYGITEHEIAFIEKVVRPMDLDDD
ncbi:Eco57I restriction-modification methylase domain-containing protein [Mycobacterium avium]|uniref:Type III restriction system endonuclease, putative n=1 Tax=Mycobacterium avium (strain 104) TaxID=243243 RepID=A0A0H2ZS78_MYCA1|nr:Eco57I restriction-modification methylase domain-containing protein [Mycobacterium avium]ABK65186.1 type III restriction system endonuclease, putative [Mycobacterium avium 104]KDP06507.1 type III restriction endonuclease [Mycobacterium avium subsp. hominissuis 101]MCG3244642.1 Eco57I restriction-modification methylase domain-containing protein [Mycobacterium avium subsp. hominissuis]